jgi:hypothetical protein
MTGHAREMRFRRMPPFVQSRGDVRVLVEAVIAVDIVVATGPFDGGQPRTETSL